MLVALRQQKTSLGRFLAVALLVLHVFTQLGHYREHRPNLTAARHAQRHAPTRHTDITAPQIQHACCVCTLASSSATLLLTLATKSQLFSSSACACVLCNESLLRTQHLLRASPRAPPLS